MTHRNGRYDLSCSDPRGCPYGSVHNVQKGPIGDRVASQLMQHFGGSGDETMMTAGPHATTATFHDAGSSSGGGVGGDKFVGGEGGAATAAPASGAFDVVVTFDGKGKPFALGATKNCTTCCAGSAPTGKLTDGHTLDFDVSGSLDGNGGWVNSTAAVLDSNSNTVTFRVALPQGATPKVVRYTASSLFPECALRNAEGLPALPFRLEIKGQV